MKSWIVSALAGGLLLAGLTYAGAEELAPPAPAANPQPAPVPLPGPVPSGLPSETPAPRAEPPGKSQLFSVALVQADNKGSTGSKLPPALEKALSDVRDFLPYRNFHLVDSGLTRAERQANLNLQGEKGEEYRALMALYRSDNGERPGFVVEQFRLDVRLPPDSTRASGVMNSGQVLGSVLTASFRIERGETVVVGSARLASVDGAVIVLLTAVP